MGDIFNSFKSVGKDGKEILPYSPAEVLDYYEEVLKRSISELERVQEKNNRALNELPDNVDVLEREDRALIEECYREVASILETTKSSLNRRIINSIRKHSQAHKFDSVCKNYWGGENNG